MQIPIRAPKNPNFTMLIKEATAHALIEEKMNLFPDLEQKYGQTSQHARTEHHYYDNCSDHSCRSNRQSNWFQVTKGGNNDRRVQLNLGTPVARKPEQLVNPRPYSKYSDYNPLIQNLEYIFHVDNQNKIPPARPLKNSDKNQDKFCH